MRKIYCDICKKDITDDTYRDFEISLHRKNEDVFESESWWGEHHLCEDCGEKVKKHLNELKEK